MDALTRNEVVALARFAAEPAVSVFLPVVEPSAGDRQDPRRLRNLLREASVQLAAYGLESGAEEELLLPAFALAEEKEFWAASPGGVALFLAAGIFRPVRVDFDLPQRLRVGRGFAVRPLLPLFARAERYYVLALSLNRVRLLESGGGGCRELHPAELPASFEAAMGHLQYYSEMGLHSSSPSALGRRPAIFHGHGDADEEHAKEDLVHFFQRVAQALERGLPDPGAPLVLASVASYIPLFRRASRRLRLLERGVEGNPDYLTNAELDAAARARVEAEMRGAVQRELERWRELRAEGRSLAELGRVVQAAEEGRVETLFVAGDAERWGTYEPDLGRVVVRESREPGDEDLLDRAAARTLAQGGGAHALPLAEMPEHSVAAAILRYPETAA